MKKYHFCRTNVIHYSGPMTKIAGLVCINGSRHNIRTQHAPSARQDVHRTKSSPSTDEARSNLIPGTYIHSFVFFPSQTEILHIHGGVGFLILAFINVKTNRSTTPKRPAGQRPEPFRNPNQTGFALGTGQVTFSGTMLPPFMFTPFGIQYGATYSGTIGGTIGGNGAGNLSFKGQSICLKMKKL